MIKLIYLLIFIFGTKKSQAETPPVVIKLNPGDVVRCCHFHSEHPRIYCYDGRPKHIIHLWETVQMELSLLPSEFEQFDGHSPDEVMSKFKQHRSSWTFSLLSMKNKHIKVDPFNVSCIGIYTEKNYEIRLNLLRVDYWKTLLLFGGILLFLAAPRLSGNSLFYYLTGVTFGTCACILIVIFIFSRFMPKRPMVYGFLVGGWTICVYLGQLIWDNLKTIAVEYRSYVLGYIGITGLISFAICYKIGPVSDPKSINLIKWALQAVGLTMILFSSDFQEAAFAINIIMLTIYNIPLRFLAKPFYAIKSYWFPYKPRLLTEEEYHQQGAIETEKALDELRGYCSSPECNQWKTVLKLKDPLRFAKFVEGSSHIDDDEVIAFGNGRKLTDDLMTDDSDSD